jgi:hypothetical protein
MGMRKAMVFLPLFFFLLSGCGGLKPEIKSPPSPSAQEEEEKGTKKIPGGILSDEELFNLGLSYLSSPDLNPDYPNAFLAFKRLTENYPESKWKDVAQHFTTILERYLKLSLENSRLHIENDELTKERELLQEEKTRWEEEKERLLKENTSLKSDLESLKKLEIESENREKNVR